MHMRTLNNNEWGEGGGRASKPPAENMPGMCLTGFLLQIRRQKIPA